LAVAPEPQPDPERVTIEFFRTAFDYYVAGRFAVLAQLGSVSVAGNLLHHAVEMALKGALAKNGKILAVLKNRYQHNLPRIWADFKQQHQGADLDHFDEVVSTLHAFEELRYPDSILSKGAQLYVDPGKRSAAPANTGPSSNNPPRYELYLGDVDELMGKVLEVANLSPKFFTDRFHGPGRQYLIQRNDVAALTTT
jgi:hypothetical protein